VLQYRINQSSIFHLTTSDQRRDVVDMQRFVSSLNFSRDGGAGFDPLTFDRRKTLRKSVIPKLREKLQGRIDEFVILEITEDGYAVILSSSMIVQMLSLI
jgi:hypothetical protein